MTSPQRKITKVVSRLFLKKIMFTMDDFVDISRNIAYNNLSTERFLTKYYSCSNLDTPTSISRKLFKKSFNKFDGLYLR